MSATEKVATPAELEALRAAAAAALADWFEAGMKAGQDPMMMAGQLTAEMQRILS